MSDVIVKCTVCHALLDEEDLFCPNCGTEAPAQTAHKPTARTATHNFQCQGCGASMSYDPTAGSLRCPFCGSVEMQAQPDAKILSPDFVVPFAVTQEQAVSEMRSWLGKGFWRPGDLAQQAAVVKMTAVYVPYWVFAASTHTYWTADSSRTPAGARASWYPLTGEHRGEHSGLLIGASGALTPDETANLNPFDLSQAVSPDQVDLENVIVEQFSVQRKYARPLAKTALEAVETHDCQANYVPGNARNVKVNVRVAGLSSQPVLLPVWIMTYKYEDRVFRFLVNGQSGQCSGQAPTSWAKIGGAVGIGAVVLAIITALLALVF